MLENTSASPASSPASELALAMAESWRQGNRRTAADILTSHPELASDADAQMRLIYEELCLRQERGEANAALRLVEQFPTLRDDIHAVVECHRWVHGPTASVVFPEIGERIGDFSILAELGRGANGRVYLADQPFLAGRTVVLKLTPCEGQEHFNLARLQHSHIVPLLWVQELPDRGLRILCMPYLGGASLDDIRRRIGAGRLDERGGAELLASVNAIEAQRFPAGAKAHPPGRRFLEKADPTEAVAWIGICLADALHYAHEQGLVHFDVRPSNVLLTGDSRPMLLDFHLARHAILPASENPTWIGGTPRYMSPEQYGAWHAIRLGVPVRAPVDSRSDIYSLGRMLLEWIEPWEGPLESESSLGSNRRAQVPRPDPAALAATLDGLGEVSVGLRDILRRCLEPEARDRYPTAAALAEDLRRQLNHLPLKGVRNRSFVERFRKWKSRRPQAVFALWCGAVVLFVAAAFGAYGWRDWSERRREAELCVTAARDQSKAARFDEAEQILRHGLARVRGVPWSSAVAQSLADELRANHERSLLDRVHRFVEKLDYLYGGEDLSPEGWGNLARGCQEMWERRHEIAAMADSLDAAEARQRVRQDLLELAIVYADIQRQVDGHEVDDPSAAARILGEAEALLGASEALVAVRMAQARREPNAPLVDRASLERFASTGSAFDCRVIGRCLLREKRYDQAAALFDRASRANASDFWPWFWKGICSHQQGQFDQSREALTVAIALRPDSAECYYNRALAYLGLDRGAEARADLDQALALDPKMAAAALNRGVLGLREGRLDEAERDIRRAIELGADPARARFNLALVYREKKEFERARMELDQALLARPDFAEARELQKSLTTNSASASDL